MQIKPKVVVFAGPNGSGKSTVTSKSIICGTYINADNIQAENNLTVMEAAQEAEKRREASLASMADFTFETVLSTERNLNLLKRAKEAGYFVRGFYVLTYAPEINVLRVKSRVDIGGHDVPEEKIKARYHRALKLLPEFVEVCDVCSIYDNSMESPVKIYKKYHGDNIIPNAVWSEAKIRELLRM